VDVLEEQTRQEDYIPTIQLHHDLSAAMIVHFFKLADITYKTLVYYAPSFFALSSNVPWRCMTVRNFTITLELGRMSTWRLPALSALLTEFRASFKTLVRVMAEQILRGYEETPKVSGKQKWHKPLCQSRSSYGYSHGIFNMEDDTDLA
jgi:hypothetical protein